MSRNKLTVMFVTVLLKRILLVGALALYER